uniref:Ribosomal protein L13 n=1 Tax=Asparagopsis taxiformis TaxID=260499 RepID=A0A1C9CCE5_9FLOR|nr:ribosomal protein L13 [Asparagopsis taxiformis]AOM66060.1 ribosomal protein L13 [Asparagopsis taxiformis]
MNKTYIPNKQSDQWYLIDAKNQTLGRLSTQIAKILTGKVNLTYTAYLENSSRIIITNAKYINVTGQKKQQKIYRRHSGRPGGLKTETFEELQSRIPNRILEKSIKGMLPKGPLGDTLFRKLKIYSDNHHPHIAQNPTTLSIY